MPPAPAPDSLRVTLVGPLPGERWISIERYARSIAALTGEAGLEVLKAPVPASERLSPIGAYVARYRHAPAMVAGGPRGDVVHIADQALGHLTAAFQGTPTVTTCHDLMPLLLEGHYRGRFEAWFDSTLLRRSIEGMCTSERIIAVSANTARDISSHLDVDPARIAVVPNMLAEEYRRRAAPEQWLARNGVRLPPRPRILSVGHTRPYKNLELLLAALAEPDLAGTSLVRCGSPLTGDQRALANRLGLASRIVELGHQEPEALAHIYNACDALAQPSRYEGFGVPVIEAMACGLPVVASDGGALKEVAGDAGLVVGLGSGGPADARAFAEGLGRVLCDPIVARRLTACGLARAETYRPGAVLPRLMAVYRAAIEERRE